MSKHDRPTADDPGDLHSRSPDRREEIMHTAHGRNATKINKPIVPVYVVEGDLAPFERWLNSVVGAFRKIVRADYAELMHVAQVALLECIRDVQTVGDRITDGGKRFVRRELLREFSRHPRHQQIPDYRYADGRSVRTAKTTPPKTKQARRRARLRAAGRCEICGKEPEKYRLCNACRLKRRRYYQSRRKKTKRPQYVVTWDDRWMQKQQDRDEI
jgi:hypothetical protein